MQRIDLHTHTTSSDGELTPGELMALAAKSDIRAIAITDHDSLDGLDEGERAAPEYGVEFVPGIELSAIYNKKEFHFLGLFIDRTSRVLTETVASCRASRCERNEQMLANLANAGVRLDPERLIGSETTVTRSHFAKAIVEGGYCQTANQAFTRYLSPDSPTYVKRRAVSAAEAIDVIRAAGGIPILAHPLRYKLDFPQIEETVAALASEGLCGLECHYSGHSFHDRERLIKLAEKYRLSISGGSDFHGRGDIRLGAGYGRLYVPYAVYEALQSFKELLALGNRTG